MMSTTHGTAPDSDRSPTGVSCSATALASELRDHSMPLRRLAWENLGRCLDSRGMTFPCGPMLAVPPGSVCYVSSVDAAGRQRAAMDSTVRAAQCLHVRLPLRATWDRTSLSHGTRDEVTCRRCWREAPDAAHPHPMEKHKMPWLCPLHHRVCNELAVSKPTDSFSVVLLQLRW
jgi:hypothetical protein